MKTGSSGIGRTLLSLAILTVLAGCTGGPNVTQNPLPADAGSGSSTHPNTPGGTNPPRTTTPPINQAIGDLVTVSANTAVLTTTRTTVYNINAAALGSGSWRPSALLEADHSAHATSPRVAFDANGNGFAVWALGNDVFMSRYSAQSASWSSPVAIDEGIDAAHQPRIAVDRSTGNAVASWTQSDGVAESIYAIRYTASSNSWSTPQVLENIALPVDDGADNSAVAIAGSHAAVSWRQYTGSGREYDLYWSRFVNGSWSAPQLLDDTGEDTRAPQVALDLNGNATVVWRQHDSGVGATHVQSRRWHNASQTLDPVVQLDGNRDRQASLQFDAQGSGFLLLRANGVVVRRFDVTTGQWSEPAQVQNDPANYACCGELSVDAAGNALAAWIEDDGTATSVYARRYIASTGAWGNPELLESMTTAADTEQTVTASLSGNDAVVAWVQNNGTHDVYGAKLNEGIWSPATLLETREEEGLEVTSTIDAIGNAAVVWVQGDGYRRSIHQARYLAAKFVVPAGATWQSIANTLYGVNSVEAASALQAAMGGGALTEGMVLSGFPATLSVVTSIPAYYTVLSTDTWSHIAQRVYGVTDVAAITQLQTLLGNPTLAAGMQLVVPTTVTFTSSANYRAPLDWSRVNTTTTMYYPLDTTALTAPLNNWAAAGSLESDNINDAIDPRVQFDASGNGIVVWTQGSDIIARRYTASTGQWAAPVVLDTNTNPALSSRIAVDRTTGDAIVTWAQSDGVAESLYVSSYDASSDSWSVAQLLENSAFDMRMTSENSSLSRAGEHAAITWLQSDGTVDNVYLSRLVAGTWTAPVVVDTGATPGLHPEVAIDANGNATVVWRQLVTLGDETRIYARRWNNTAQAFGAVMLLDDQGDRQPRIGFDAQGNGIALWRGEGVFARHYDVTTDTWGAEVQLHFDADLAWNGELAVDASGDALVTWVQSDGTVDSVYARHYDAAAAAWGAPVLLENLADPASLDHNPTVSLVDGSGVVAWAHKNASGRQDLYAARFGNGVWGSAALLESRFEDVSQLASHIDTDSNATVVWIQQDGWADTIFQARSDATPYFVVPAGATWQSLANALYGVDSEAAASALRTAMGNPTLTTGLRLTSLPATLAVSPTVPTHYLVRSGDTWQSILPALYGTSREEAVTALRDYLGQPTLTVGDQLLVPGELSYTIVE